MDFSHQKDSSWTFPFYRIKTYKTYKAFLMHYFFPNLYPNIEISNQTCLELRLWSMGPAVRCVAGCPISASLFSDKRISATDEKVAQFFEKLPKK